MIFIRTVSISATRANAFVSNSEKLRELAYAASETSQIFSQAKRNIYQRSNDVRIYVLVRAKGKGEGCGVAAPFLRLDGSAYLEPHHLRRLSDGGPNYPAHVIALCPNCHRRVHRGGDGKFYNDKPDRSDDDD